MSSSREKSPEQKSDHMHLGDLNIRKRKGKYRVYFLKERGEK